MIDEQGKTLWARVCTTVTRLGQPRSSSPHDYVMRPQVVSAPAMIDLHGLTLQNAWLTVRSFIDETPHRDVTIITGRGQMSVEITSWLSQCPRYQSHSVLNGGGAFRVRVRR